MSAVDLSVEVKAFAVAMEAKLRANDHKGGWKQSPVTYLFSRLEEEVAELKKAVVNGGTLGEAADVANFAMMIADTHGGLPLAAESKLKATESERPKEQVKLTNAGLAFAIHKVDMAETFIRGMEAQIDEWQVYADTIESLNRSLQSEIEKAKDSADGWKHKATMLEIEIEKLKGGGK